MMSITTVGDNDFDEKVLKSDLPVLVIFMTTWSKPDKLAIATLEELAPSYSEKINMYTLDIDESPATSQKFVIRGVPTTLIFKNGDVAQQYVGNAPKAKFQSLIDSAL